MKVVPRKTGSSVFELAGLPGAGKTTICRQVAMPHLTKPSVGFQQLPRLDVLPVAWHVTLLGLGMRPFRWRRIVRAANFVVLLRCYAPLDQPVLLDQGLVQKLWSLLIDVQTYSKERLQRVFATLRPFAPRYTILVETPLDTVALRISERSHGTSRFDNLPLDEINCRLAEKTLLLTELIELYLAHTGATLVRLDGRISAEQNARKIDELLAREFGQLV